MLEVSNIALSLDAGLAGAKALMREQLAYALSVNPKDIGYCKLIKRSIDARKKTNVHFIASFQLDLSPALEKHLLAHPPRGIGVRVPAKVVPLSLPQKHMPKTVPVVVGAGPAGLFAALYLARCGLCPVLLERGAPVAERACDVAHFNETGQLDVNSNIQFGEGGAGTFSDGKLTTNTKNTLTSHVLNWFVEAGAPADILWQAHPHLGSDNLPRIVETMRNEIIARGGTVLFHARLCDIELKQGKLVSLTYEQASCRHILFTHNLIVACGHSARDTFEMLNKKGFAMQQKPFSMGVRIEHPQEYINRAQWGAYACHPALGAAEYKMAVHLPNGRSVYTFCMCPGGEVVAAASEPGGVVTNGMSTYSRDGHNANAALLVNVDPADFGGSDALAGVRLQQSIERRAFQLVQDRGGAPYQAPVQTVGAFLGTTSTANEEAWQIKPTYTRGVVEVPLEYIFPSFVSESLKQALFAMGRKLKGFDNPGALMTAPETRSSSPVRICRTKSFQAYFTDETYTSNKALKAALDDLPDTGVFPCGEGPGFAGGIMSAAVDGLRVAEAVAQRYD